MNIYLHQATDHPDHPITVFLPATMTTAEGCEVATDLHIQSDDCENNDEADQSKK